MNKLMFFTGLGVFALELLGILIYFMTTINYGFLSMDLIVRVAIFTFVGLINICAAIFFIVGALTK